MGVVSPVANTLADFEAALRAGRSGIRRVKALTDYNFGCQVGGLPSGIDELKTKYFTEEALFSMNSHMIYGGIAAIDAWKDAGFEVPAWNSEEVNWDTGAVLGTGVGGLETLEALECERKVKAGQVRRLGGTIIEQTMASAASSRLSGLLALGGHVTTNSTACATGTESIAEAYLHVATGRAKRMLAGGTEGATERSAPFMWGGFDAMRVLARGFNDTPEKASRPLSASATGFVPSAGAGVMLLETLDSALARGARVYAEILGANVNSGGQRGGGTMTAANPEGVVRCLRQAVRDSGIGPEQVDFLNGHLTATGFDVPEVENWRRALERKPGNFPKLTATKSLLGHGLGAAGAWESIATVLMLHREFLHPSLNCEDWHPGLAGFEQAVVRVETPFSAKIAAKASFGFGDINACIVFRKWEQG